jgi:hypothetical protein
VAAKCHGCAAASFLIAHEDKDWFMFRLEKWYLDLVTDDGTAVVGYAAELVWRVIRLRYASLLVCDPATAPAEVTSLREGPSPEFTEGRLRWTSDALRVRGEWLGLDAPIERTLLSSPAGAIEWSCLVPRARAAVETASARYEGLGYAERLRLTLPPWAFPFRTLRWGRHLSNRHALVWIEWDGDPVMRVAWLDGEPQPMARVVTSGVTGLARHRELRWHSSRDLSRRAVEAVAARAAPALAARLAGRLATMQEHKQLSRSSLVDADGSAVDTGWAIHEVVTW